jgi:hypothetical protein
VEAESSRIAGGASIASGFSTPGRGGAVGGAERVTYVRTPPAPEEIPWRGWTVRAVSAIAGSRSLPGGSVRHGIVAVDPPPVTFLRMPFEPGRRRGDARRIEVPRDSSEMTAVWLEPEPALVDRVREDGHSVLDACLGLGHILRLYSALYVTIPPDDLFAGYVRGEGFAITPRAVFLLGRMRTWFGSGRGWAKTVLRRAPEILRDGLEILESCECRKGCPSCVGYHEIPRVRSGRTPPSEPVLVGHAPAKGAAQALLRGILENRAAVRGEAPGRKIRRASRA